MTLGSFRHTPALTRRPVPTVARLGHNVRALVTASGLSLVVASATGCGSLCRDFHPSPASGSGACADHSGVLITASSILRGLLLLGLGVYLWRRGSRGVLAG